MPASARRTVVDPDVVAVDHVWGRCVRRAWLCGDDPVSGIDYSTRRQSIRQLQEQLAALFAIEIEFHAEMSNRLHLVLRTRPDIVGTWSGRATHFATAVYDSTAPLQSASCAHLVGR